MHSRPHLFGVIPLPTPAELLCGLAFQSAIGATPAPTFQPTDATFSPNRILPSASPTIPTYFPSARPSSAIPTRRPTLYPTFKPTKAPTGNPIQPPKAPLVKIDGHSISSNSIKPGEISVIKVYGLFADGSIQNITRNVTVESSNPNVVSVTQEYTGEGELVLRGLSVGWSIVQYRINNFYSKKTRMTVWSQKGCFHDYAPDYIAYN